MVSLFVTNVSIRVFCIICLHQKHKTMRSLLLSRLSGLCLRKPRALGVRHLGGARFFTETCAYRCVLGEDSADIWMDGDEYIGRLVTGSVASPYIVGEYEPVLMDSITGARTIGASQGWVASLKDGVVCLHDDYKTDSKPKRLSLPPIVRLPYCQTEVVTNVAMSSSSPDEDEDCILAVKFRGAQLSLCRPAQKDPEWVNIRIEDPCFFSSRVIYSMRDKMFSVPSYGGTRILSWDLEEYRHKPKCRGYYLANVPEFIQTEEWKQIDSRCTSEELVESRPTGEMFIVKRFKMRNNDAGRMEERRMMVFKLMDCGRACLTEDIGDLCMFLSMSEPFCLEASLCGRAENDISFMDHKSRGNFNNKSGIVTSEFGNYTIPYYFPPLVSQNTSE